MPAFLTSLSFALLRLGWTHLSMRPGRTLLTILGVGLGVAAAVAVQRANLDVLASFEHTILTVAGPTTIEIQGSETGIDERLIATVRPLPGVQSASPVVAQTVVRLEGEVQRQSIQVLGLDLLAESESRGFRLQRTEGENQLDALLEPESLYIGRRAATEWNVAVGSTVEVMAGTRPVTLRIAGVIDDPREGESSWDHLAIMDIAAAQVQFGLVGRLDRIDVVTSPTVSIDDAIRALRVALPPHVTVERPARRTQKVEDMVRAFRLNLMVLSWVGLLVGVFLIYNTMSFAIAQRRREIGIYRAIGMTQGRVTGLFLAEGALLGTVGGIVGSIAGLVLSQVLVTLLSRTISDLYVAVGMGAGSLAGAGELLRSLSEGVAVGCVVSILGALGPSLDAGRTVAVRALAPGDYESSRAATSRGVALGGCGLLLLAGGLSLAGPVDGLPLPGYAAAFALLAGLSCIAPFCVTGGGGLTASAGTKGVPQVHRALRSIAIDHAGRNPGRNGVTVSALMVGLAIMIGVIIMVRSFRHTVELWIDETVMADVVVAPPTWLRGTVQGGAGRNLPPDWEARLAKVPGVSAVDSYRDVRGEMQGRRVSIVSRDLRLHAERSRYQVRTGDSSTVLRQAAEQGGVLVSEVLAHQFSVKEGQVLEIPTPEGVRSFPIVAVFYDYGTHGGKVVMDRALYRSLWHDDLVTVFAVYMRPGVDPGSIRSRMAAVLAEGRRTQPPLLISNGELRKEILEIFDRTFVMTYVLEAIAVVIAMLGIVNTLITSILERRREFATLQAIGGSAGQITQLVLWEGAYLGLLGIVLGLVGGGALSVLLVIVVNKQSFGWTIQMIVPVSALLQVVGLAGASTLLAGYLPARWAARQPIGEVLRGE